MFLINSILWFNVLIDALHNLFIPKSSTVKDARADPVITAFKKSNLFELARHPINPPAKESPAPVGSITLLIGKTD